MKAFLLVDDLVMAFLKNPCSGNGKNKNKIKSYYILPQQFGDQCWRMRNNFVPSFHKKDPETANKTGYPFFLKNPSSYVQNPVKQTVKKMSFHIDAASSFEFAATTHNLPTTEEESFSFDKQGSCKSSERTIKPSKLQQMGATKEHRIVSPLKFDNTSPQGNRSTISPNTKESRIGSNAGIPVRATLKNLLQIKTSPRNKNEQNINTSKNINKETQLTSSYRANRTVTEMHPFSPSKNMEKQYYVLREENQKLRKELSEIKRSLNVNTCTRKEDLISNLRDTIKKEDNQIKELRVKLDIFSKKNAVLTTLIENKDEEIAFLSTKLDQVQQELREHRQKSAERMQRLKERINYMLKCYSELQVKWGHSQMEWLQFKESWLQEKQTYTQRISFLEQYIADN